MTTTHADYLPVAHLADQAANAIRVLNHRARTGTGHLTNPSEAAEIIAALATMTDMLPQLLDQLARWLQREDHDGRLAVDELAPLPDSTQTVRALIDHLRRAAQRAQRTAVDLDTAHEHAAHLSTPAASDRGQNSCGGFQ